MVGTTTPHQTDDAASNQALAVHDDMISTHAGPERLAYRRKVCLVGPSGWGKTSLVQSLKALAPSLSDEADRTLGIELHRLAFEMEETSTSTTQFELALWDFAGQDVYQSAHSLFFSKDALYLLCVDTKAYADALNESDAMSMRAGEALRNRFLTRHIFSWLRLIFSRDPSAEVVIVGTKTDLLKNEKTLQLVWRDLRLQLSEWKRRYVDEIEKELQQHAETSAGASSDSSGAHSRRSLHSSSLSSRYSGSAHHASSFEELREKVNSISFDDWIPVSCTDQASIEAARQALETRVAASENNVDMSGRNADVLDFIISRREDAARMSSTQDRIESSIVPLPALFSKLMFRVDGLEDHQDCAEIMRVLHQLGEIAWFEHENAGPLKDYVILDPTIVISLVREALNHESVNTAGDISIAHFEEGRVTHEILSTFPIWQDLDKDLKYAFKLLLQFFQLAYPANDQEVDWDSDLIVPAYWKIRKPAVDKRLLQQQTMMARHGVVPVATVCWEYELSAEVSDTIFEQFAVQSYTALFQRAVWPNCIESFVEGDFASRIALSPGEMMRDVICIEVAVENPEVRWQYLRYYAMTLEKVLDNYPGLSVSRYIVDGMGDRHRLSEATSRLEDTVRRGQDEGSVRQNLPWVPPDLNWYIEKAWQTPGKLQQLQMRDLVKQTVNRLDVLQKLIVAGDSQRRYPALWTLAFNAEAKQIELKMLSDLSGKCFHLPIQIQVPNKFLAKYGSWLQTGLWVCSNVVPEVISLGIVQKVIDLASPVVDSHVERAEAVHSLIDNLDLSPSGEFNSKANQTLSPRGTIALLRDILKLYDGNFDELTICDLCNLECAATADGYYIWAHRHEIMSMGEQLTPCDRDDFKLSGVVKEDDGDIAESPCEPKMENNGSPSLSPTNTDSPTSSPPESTWTCSPDQTPDKNAKESSAQLSKFLPLNLSFVSANGLTELDWRRTYCKWQLLYGESKTPLAAGVTPQHVDSSLPPTWSSSPAFALACVVSVDMLRECRLAIRLKRPSRFVVTTKLIGEGVVRLRDFIPNDADLQQQFECKPIEIDVGSGSSQRSVAISLSAA